MSSAGERPSLWTPANVVTVTRVMLVPLWLAVAECSRTTDSSLALWVSPALYALISLTDKLDGYLARSRNEVTTFGKFLDPIADKLAVIVALLFLLELGVIPSWVAFAIIARELMVDGLRMVAASTGRVIAAGSLGKLKTATTMLAICLLLVGIAADGRAAGHVVDGNLAYLLTSVGWPLGTMAPVLNVDNPSVFFATTGFGLVLLYGAVMLTVWSGIDYFVKIWPAIRNDDATTTPSV